MTEEYIRLQEISNRRIRETSLEIHRALFDIIDWRDRLICISGARGVGKTTLILQHIKEAFGPGSEETLYISLDNLLFEKYSLEDVVREHYNSGGTYIFIDEVHYLRQWQTVIKNIYDDYPGLHVVYTGSSLLRLEMEGADLSRRQVKYELPGLSFREYLLFEYGIIFEKANLTSLLTDHISIANEILAKEKVLKAFPTYLKKGYYPFYKEVYAGYEERIQQVVNQILESDYPAVESISYTTIQKIKKMLYILAQSCPQTPKMSELYAELDTDRNQGLKLLYTLEKANLLSLISSEKATLSNMSKPDKIYCDNTNIMYCFTEHINIGTVRETFFVNQVKSAGYLVTYPKQGDFLVDNKALFEVGGRKKSFDQIADLKNSYLAVDDVEVGLGNRIPLWMFGFLY
jgi:predicted AAA+ superfamily ATPase